MDYLTNFSLKYTEIEDEAFFCDSYNDDDDTQIGKYHYFTPDNSITILSPLMFSRQSSLDSLSTPSSNDYSIQSDYSYYISSNVSPSDIPDSPSEMMPKLSRPSDNNRSKRPIEMESKNHSSINDDDDEVDKNLLESCLQMGIYSMHHNNHHQTVECSEYSSLSEDGDGDMIESEHLLEKCWRNGIKAFTIKKL